MATQDSTTQSQELTDEQKETLRTQREAVASNVCTVFDSIGSVGDKAERAKMYSRLLSDLVGREGLTNETLFKRMLNDYPYSIEHEVELESIECDISENYSSEHEVSTTISVEDSYVDIEVMVDLQHEVYHGPSIDLSKEISLDGCDIIAAYMKKAGTDNPVFFLAKVAELLMEGVESKARGDAAMETHKQYEVRLEGLTDELKNAKLAINACNDAVELERMVKSQERQKETLIEQRDSALDALKETDKLHNRMQERVFALTDVLQDVESGLQGTTMPDALRVSIMKAIKEHGLPGDK